MQLNQLKRKTSNKKSSRVGRGGKRGKTSGRGHKGQKARAGNSTRPAIRDMIKKLPKRRGRGINIFKSTKIKPTPVNLADLEAWFKTGEEVTPKSLLEKKVVKRSKGKLPKVKILSYGKISKKLVISRCSVSESARKEIEKAGGSIS